jgi:acetyl esterase/lipase
MMGFSAGGEVVSMVAFGSESADVKATDEIDRVDFRPNFLIMIYPGPLGVPDVVRADAPPAFLLAANDDECCSPPVMKLLQRYRDAKIPVEAHIYAHGSHAFNMGRRSQLASIKGWPQRMADWLADNHFLDAH